MEGTNSFVELEDIRLDNISECNSEIDKLWNLHGGLNEARGPKYPCIECLELFNTKLSLFTHMKKHELGQESLIENHVPSIPFTDNPENFMINLDYIELDLIDEVISEDCNTMVQSPISNQTPQIENRNDEIQLENDENLKPEVKKVEKKAPKNMKSLPKPQPNRSPGTITTRSGRKIKQPPF